ncbi:hypothetical protein [Halorussus salinisoli]|uniref:hypothetical protein n=1 Tax=Halorussus salinisoli TaxID=2558242 RepID=UPI0010C19C69|nr:hypothetical protein [Halorussus salinisoli]
MDRDRLIELAAHYVAMLLMWLVVITGLRALVGELSFWIELAVIVVVVLAYRLIVQQLGIAPRAWKKQ